MKHPKLVNGVSWICIVLTLTTLTHELCLAASETPAPADPAGNGTEHKVDTLTLQRVVRTYLAQTDDPALPDSAWGDWQPADTLETFLLFDAPGDSLPQGPRDENVPVFRKWWFWAAGIAALVLIAILASGNEEKGPGNLPDFPDPPDR